ncbi:MAG: F0F1 ATP synthase subunit B [Candidatus Omnitrophica bacterium]|nr:F0F1 ATP synthase subunit B [Candidatus Omnitrophota bacterium]
MIEISFTMVLQWINFGILLFFLTKVLYKPLLNVLDKRRALVEGELAEAKKKKDDAQEILREYEQRLGDLRSEGRKIIDDARRQAVLEKDKILDSASMEAKLILENARLEMEAQATVARDEIKRQVAELVVDCASKVVEREVREEDHQKYIEDFITRVK